MMKKVIGILLMATPVIASFGVMAYYNLRAFLVSMGAALVFILLIGLGSYLVFGDE